MTSLPRISVHGLTVILCLALLFQVALPVRAQPTDEAIDKLVEIAKDRKKLQPRADEDELRRLLLQRYNVALEELTQRCEDFRRNLGTRPAVFQAARDLLQAELELQEKPEGRAGVLEKTLEVVKWYEARQERAWKEGQALRADYLRTQFIRLNLEIELLKTRREIRGTRSK
jgi:hypothetical protein